MSAAVKTLWHVVVFFLSGCAVFEDVIQTEG
jgi:hypothetical protein